MVKQRKSIIRRVDKGLFFIVVALGAVSIAFLKDFGVPQLFVTLAPVFLLLVYALLVVSGWSRFRLRYDQAGDNCYYLGFIYTLVSLGLALYHFNGSATSVADEIIRNFGIALATTIVGVTLRVLLHQMREDPVDIEATARRELRDVAAHVTGQLNATMREVVSFRRRTQDELKHFAYETKQAAEEYRSAVKTFNDQSLKLGASIGKMITRVEDIEISPDLIDRKLTPATNEIGRLVSQVSGFMESEQTRQEALTRQLQQSGEAVAKIAHDAEAQLASQASDLMEREQMRQEALTRQLQQSGEAVAHIAHVAEALGQMGEFPKQITASFEQMSQTTKAMADMQDKALTMAERLESSVQALDKLKALGTVLDRIERFDRDMQRPSRFRLPSLFGRTGKNSGG